jgi:uncharacterized protein (DUF433 family)
MMTLNGVTHRHPESLSGVPVFVGTRAPVRSLFDCRRAGEMCGIFLIPYQSILVHIQRLIIINT